MKRSLHTISCLVRHERGSASVEWAFVSVITVLVSLTMRNHLQQAQAEMHNQVILGIEDTFREHQLITPKIEVASDYATSDLSSQCMIQPPLIFPASTHARASMNPIDSSWLWAVDGSIDESISP